MAQLNDRQRDWAAIGGGASGTATALSLGIGSLAQVIFLGALAIKQHPEDDRRVGGGGGAGGGAEIIGLPPEVATLAFPPINRADPNVPANVYDSLDDLAAKFMGVIAAGRAFDTALLRLGAAVALGNCPAAEIQLRAASELFYQFRDRISAASHATSQFADAYAASGLPDPMITSDVLAALAARVNQYGLPEDELNLLAHINASDRECKTIVDILNQLAARSLPAPLTFVGALRQAAITGSGMAANFGQEIGFTPLK